MDNLWTIYSYELKKLTGRKLLWITAFLCAAGIVITVFAGLLGTYSVDGKPIESNYEGFRKDQAYRQALSGRPVDQTLLLETVEAYRHVPSNVARYSLTEEYEAFARPYSAIFNLIRSWTGMDLAAIQNWDVKEADLYESRIRLLEQSWQSFPLTEAETDFWREQESRMETPIVYHCHEGYSVMLNSLLTVGVLMLLFTAVCLSGLFADEHILRTDQLVLSSIAGQDTVYWAKLAAGVTVSAAAAGIMALLTAGLSLGFYGAGGFDTPFQVFYSAFSFPITIGQACLIACGAVILTSVLAAVFVMVLSELLHSGTAALAVSSALIILGNMITIPTQYRVIAQLWDWSPTAYLSVWNIFDPRTLPLFGRCLLSWQAVPVIYLLLAVLLALAGHCRYRRYQVSGR